jgi:4-amino-4-deoxy-L-arabinose transferase-like glycosyltransferase
MDETLGRADGAFNTPGGFSGRLERHYQLVVVLIAAAVFFGCIISPPSLMDDVDAVQAAIARHMLDSGDWVTAYLNGIKYLEKSPFVYWTIAASFAVFGTADWAARIPIALSAVLLCWLTARFAAWAFSPRAGLWAGLALATSVGLFLFTRILIPDVMLTATVALALWALLRVLEEDEPHPRLWAAILAASLGLGLIIKGLIAVVAPCGAALTYLLVTGQLLKGRTWQRIRPFSGALILLLIAAPWHVLATLRNPPYLDLTMSSGPGNYRGFFWFYFINEHVLRFLNLRFPRDYNTVPRLQFWLLHLLWLFPWSVFFPAAARLSYRPANRTGRVRLLCLCWAGFVMAFFTFSTTQEYYSMPIYPALALLVGSAVAAGGQWVFWGTRVAATVAAVSAAVMVWILVRVHGLPAPGDIAGALTHNPDAYTLSLGHMQDLTIESFAYLRLPLMVALIACLFGAAGGWLWRNGRALLALTAMMLLFVHAARLALVVFDPYLSSRPLAEALREAPLGRLIVDDQYYAFSSIFFYANANTTALLLNGRVNNLEYGSNAPGAPAVFLADADVPPLWSSSDRYYLVLATPALPRVRTLVGEESLRLVKASGGKFLFTNHPVPQVPGAE